MEQILWKEPAWSGPWVVSLSQFVLRILFGNMSFSVCEVASGKVKLTGLTWSGNILPCLKEGNQTVLEEGEQNCPIFRMIKQHWFIWEERLSLVLFGLKEEDMKGRTYQEKRCTTKWRRKSRSLARRGAWQEILVHVLNLNLEIKVCKQITYIMRDEEETTAADRIPSNFR